MEGSRRKGRLPKVVLPPLISNVRGFLLSFSMVVCLGETLGFALRLTEENKAEVTEKEEKRV